MTGQLIYPGASKAQWFADNYRGDVWSYPLEKWVWHSTETSGWPGYGGGKSAPTMTVMFDMARRVMAVRQHFPANMSARALQNDDGGVQTNRDKLIQVEIVGTCDPKSKHKPYLPELPDWALRELAKLVAWGQVEWGIPARSTVPFVAYPKSYGERASQRLHGAAFNGYRGHLGHQHVDENDHGDPGALKMARIITFANEILRPLPPVKPIATEKDDDMFIATHSGRYFVVDGAGKRLVTKAAADELTRAGVRNAGGLGALTLNEFPTYVENGTHGGSTDVKLDAADDDKPAPGGS